ncbi:hypothetical protein [Bradyrhizobium sp. RDI18]|uniref:hypothetical protein n=1 Tax=Bradyrhizobium sp. RDI18 TaxID=3367400 RepID=UPI0037125D51
MALHRDILWIGKQWAVTGHGMQLIDQRLMGAFDIEVARLWDDDLIERMHAKEWLNAADFDKGLAVAGAPVAAALPAIEPVAASSTTPADASAPSLPTESAQQASPELQMKIDGGARFARPWRVWMKKT